MAVKSKDEIGYYSETGSYWVDKTLTCNGCKYLHFPKRGCRRNQPPGQVRRLNSYVNDDKYIAVLRPSDCDYVRKTKKEEEPSDQNASQE